MEKFKKITYDNETDYVEDLLVDKVKEVLDFKTMIYRNELIDSLYDCESPIEQILSMEIVDIINEYTSFSNIDLIGFDNQVDIKCGNKKYRVDFLIEVAFKYNGEHKHLLKLIIECDGHDFHEKTKEQVIKDNKRNRDLQNEGYEILHFSGSEIYKYHYRCGEEIKKFIIKKYLLFLSEEKEK